MSSFGQPSGYKLMGEFTMSEQDFSGEFQSKGGFIFGIVGWAWGKQHPSAITFFTDGSAKVSDQHGRPIKGTVVDGKQVLFAPTPPIADRGGAIVPRPENATHAQVVAALAAEKIDWRTLTWAGWPQLPADELRKLPELPPTPVEELSKIKDRDIRRDALRLRREADEAMAKELQAVEQE